MIALTLGFYPKIHNVQKIVPVEITYSRKHRNIGMCNITDCNIIFGTYTQALFCCTFVTLPAHHNLQLALRNSGFQFGWKTRIF